MKNKCEDLIAAKEWYRIAKEQDNKLAIEILESKFPELKEESEDERVRNFLIGYFDKLIDENSEWGLTKETREKIITWLEKQGNLMKALQISNAKIGELIEENYYLKEQLEKQGDYNRLIKEIKECKELFSKEKRKAICTNDKLSLGGRIAMLEELLAFTKEKQGEQKPADEIGNYDHKEVLQTIINEQKPAELPKGEDYGIDGLYHAIRILEETLGSVDGYQSDDGILEHKCAISAVKQLAKQNNAWNEEDEKMLNKLLAVVTLYYGYTGNVLDKQSCTSFLKSLKDRYTWKPSDKQLEAVKRASGGSRAIAGNDYLIMESLYNDLRKLMKNKI